MKESCQSKHDIPTIAYLSCSFITHVSFGLTGQVIQHVGFLKTSNHCEDNLSFFSSRYFQKKSHFHFLSHQFQFNWNLSDECRELAFPSFYFFANKRLENHNITTVRVRDMNACELRCYHEPNCVSINFPQYSKCQGNIQM